MSALALVAALALACVWTVPRALVLGAAGDDGEWQEVAEQLCAPKGYLKDREGNILELNGTERASVAEFRAAWRSFRRERPVQRVLSAARSASADDRVAELLVNNTEHVLERMDTFAGFNAFALAVVDVAQSHGAVVRPESEARLRALAESMDALISWDNTTQKGTRFFEQMEGTLMQSSSVMSHSAAVLLSDRDVGKICRSIAPALAPAFASLFSGAVEFITGMLIALALGSVLMGVGCACCVCRC